MLRRAAERRKQAYRQGTRANIQSHLRLYVAFAFQFSFTDFPATGRVLQAFAEFLFLTYKAPKSVLNALASIGHFHLDHGLDTGAFEFRELQLWRRALPHTCRHVPKQAPPITVSLLRRLCGLALGLGEAGMVLAALMAIAFASMARLSSLLPAVAAKFDATRLPTFADMQRRDGVWHLLIKWGKAHQDAATGYWVPLLPLSGSPACPVARWLDLRRCSGSPRSTASLFWSTRSRRGGGVDRQPLTMALARAWLRILLARLGEGDSTFSFHSFRRGACTTAFLQGADEQDLRRLGGWRSDAVSLYLPLGESRQRAARALSAGAGAQAENTT